MRAVRSARVSVIAYLDYPSHRCICKNEVSSVHLYMPKIRWDNMRICEQESLVSPGWLIDLLAMLGIQRFTSACHDAGSMVCE